MAKITTGILGATAYTGVELVKILSRHAHASIAFISSRSYAQERFSAVFGEVSGLCDETLILPDEAIQQKVDCVFSCLPHAVSAELCIPFIEKGVRVIDLSADFRIRDASVYEQWYGQVHPRPELLQEAVYGLPEWYREQIRTAQIVANPGCYPTGILLPLLPLLKSSDISLNAIIADSKSGVSGAGRSLKLSSHFVEAHDNFSAYAVGRKHRHIAEIDQELSRAAGRTMAITFAPHLVPLNRGILSTIYCFTEATAEECCACVKDSYTGEPFVRVRQESDLPKVRYVAQTNYCDIAFTGGQDGQPVIAVSALDNLIKGASGQAVQNMNVMFGIDEIEGLL